MSLSAPALFAAVPTMAQSNAALPPRDLPAETLEVPLHKSLTVKADRPIATAMIGDPKIADIQAVDPHTIFVIGKEMGTTSLTLYDARGRVMAIMNVAVGPDVETLNTQLNVLLPGQNVVAQISNKSIVLTGTVNGAGAADRAARLARAFVDDDKQVINLISVGSSQQVMLEVRFAEVNRTSGKEFGISAFGNSAGGSFSGAFGQSASLTPGAGGIGIIKLDPITGQSGIFSQDISLGPLSLQGILNAMEAKGLARTLAQPTLIALSGERASFLAGGEFPVPVAQSGGGGGAGGNNGQAITVEFKTFGVSLAFTPTVLSDNTINLVVEPEVSEIDPTASLTLNGITIPGLRTRRVSTTLELRDGESFAIAGLLQQDTKVQISQMPLLGSLPIIGTLFRSTRYQKGETELLIVVTPRLVAPIKPSQVRLPTDRVRDPSDVETFLLGQPYQPQELAPIADPKKGAAPDLQTSLEGKPAPHKADPAQTGAAATLPPAKDDNYEF